MKILLGVLLGLSVLCSGTVLFVGFGGYDVSATSRHWPVTASFMEFVRDRSVGRRAQGMALPTLTDPALIKEGAGHYDAMCVDCHLKPGKKNTELRMGLYPLSPNLTEVTRDPAESFLIIKDGIKMSGMPAWGITHDDQSIWGLVSFLQVLPELDAASYEAMIAEAGGHDHSAHSHGGEHDTGAHDAPGQDKGGAPAGSSIPLGHEGHQHDH